MQRPTVIVREGDRFVRRGLSFGKQTQIIAIGGCHFADDAMRDIDADPELQRAFANARWLLPQEATGSLDRTRDSRLVAVYRRDEYPMTDEWSSPVFYFLRDGAVVHKVVGWPKQGRRDELRGLRLLGL